MSLDQVEKKGFSYVYLIMNIGERQSIMQNDRKLSIPAIRRQNIVKFMNHKDRYYFSEWFSEENNNESVSVRNQLFLRKIWFYYHPHKFATHRSTNLVSAYNISGKIC